MFNIGHLHYFMQYIDQRVIYLSAHNMGHARLSTQVSIQKQLKYQTKIKWSLTIINDFQLRPEDFVIRFGYSFDGTLTKGEDFYDEMKAHAI